MDRSCPACLATMAPTAAGWACAWCGHAQARASGPGVAFKAHAAPFGAPGALRTGRPNGPAGQPALRRPRRRGGGLALAVAALLLLAGIGTAGYVLLTQPEGRALLALAEPEGPSDYRAPVAVEGVYHRNFEWSFQGSTYTWSMEITEASYDYFRNLDRPVRRHQEGGVWHVQPAYDIYVSNPDDDLFVEALAASLLDLSRKEGFSDTEAMSFALAFVQSLPYTKDDVTTGFDEYPRFPVETLVDNGGDCEDTSILFASLAKAMGFGAILVSPPGHMAVGVQAPAEFPGRKYSFAGHWFAYSETTGDGYGFGEIPKEYAMFPDEDTKLYALTPKPLFALDVQFGHVTRDGRQQVQLTATHTGSAAGDDVRLVATLGRGDAIYDHASCNAGEVPVGRAVSCTLWLDLNKVPKGARVSIRCSVQDSKYLYDEASSTEWIPRG